MKGDSSLNITGGAARYEIPVVDEIGRIQSAGYPEYYGNHIYTEWLLVAPVDYGIKFTFQKPFHVSIVDGENFMQCVLYQVFNVSTFWTKYNFTICA